MKHWITVPWLSEKSGNVELGVLDFRALTSKLWFLTPGVSGNTEALVIDFRGLRKLWNSGPSFQKFRKLSNSYFLSLEELRNIENFRWPKRSKETVKFWWLASEISGTIGTLILDQSVFRTHTCFFESEINELPDGNIRTRFLNHRGFRIQWNSSHGHQRFYAVEQEILKLCSLRLRGSSCP